MPTLQLHIRDPGGSHRTHAITYRRALHRGARWLALELTDGAILLCRQGGAPPRVTLHGDAAARFRTRLHGARHLDASAPQRYRRCEALCYRLAHGLGVSDAEPLVLPPSEEQAPCPIDS